MGCLAAPPARGRPGKGCENAVRDPSSRNSTTFISVRQLTDPLLQQPASARRDDSALAVRHLPRFSADARCEEDREPPDTKG